MTSPWLLLLVVIGLLTPGPDDLPPPLAALPAATVTVDAKRDEIVIELPPVDLPANLVHEGMHADHGDGAGPGFPPVVLVTMPVSGALYGFRVELVDSAGERLPDVLLHHLNFIDPFHRELFLPISRRVIAAGKETGGQRLPWALFGLPFKQGDRLVLNAMLHNPTPAALRHVRTRLVVSYTAASRPWPLFDVFPWQLDVLFPVGDKAFDLPPGRSRKFYDAKPALAGKIVGLGGHVHERALELSLTDVTAGKVLWAAAPTTDSTGRVVGVPVARFYRWNRVGVPIDTSHVYRVSVEYDNRTGGNLPQGGMGVIGGLFAPEDPDAWPTADMTDPLYLQDLAHYLRLRGDAAAAPAAQAASGHHHSHH
ncbi:MAG: hypothetical protein ACRD08_12870 [Acidimicrobiales bacterium]